MSLLDSLRDSPSYQPVSVSDWKPTAPDPLDGIEEIELDFETTGVRWWKDDMPIGVAIGRPDGRCDYYPWAHRAGGNLDEAVVARFFKEQIKGKLITNLNTRFEVHMARKWGAKWGFDLEAQGNRVSDVGHQAALLDDHRQRFSQESLVNDYLMATGERKVKVVNGIELNERDMASHHASLVAVRAIADVRQVQMLKNLFKPKLEEQDLMRVKTLEDQLIWVTAEMEKNGTKIDIELLERYLAAVRHEIEVGLMEIAKLLGRAAQTSLFEGAGKEDRPFNPDSPRDMQLLFEHLKLPIARTEEGRPSFTAAVMKSHKHPVVEKVFRLGKLIDVESKLLQYDRSVDRSTGILRYALHQLRAEKDPFEDFGAAGTVSGRYSSTKIETKPHPEGINIQSVWKAAQQRRAFGFDENDTSHDDDIFIIRKLHIAESGYEHLSADAMQIEYRLFADDTRSERLLQVYRENPMVSYHKMIHKQVLEHKPDLSYRRCKDTNFAKQYGAGLRKMGLMLEYLTPEQYRRLLNADNWFADPLLDEVKEINRIYDLAVPEVAPLLSRAGFLAMETCDKKCKTDKWRRRFHREGLTHRGFIRTLLGRRTRFPGSRRTHKALNARIQGGGADIMKIKLVELHAARHETGFVLRWPLHDEVDGDIPNREAAMIVNRILNQQSVKTHVPITWEVGTGPNWGDQDDLPIAFNGKLYTKVDDDNWTVTEDAT